MSEPDIGEHRQVDGEVIKREKPEGRPNDSHVASYTDLLLSLLKPPFLYPSWGQTKGKLTAMLLPNNNTL